MNNVITVKNMSPQDIILQYNYLPIPKIIAFDLDETLHDIIEIYEDSVNKVRMIMGDKLLIDSDFREMHKNGFITNDKFFQILYPHNYTKAMQLYYNIFHDTVIPKNNILPGVVEMLNAIKYNFKLIIIGVTNSEQHMAKKALRDLGLFEFFNSVTGPKGKRKLKPETELLVIGLNKVNKKPSKHVWFIGDSPTDTICAKKAGCIGIRFFKKNKPQDDFADLFCNSYFELTRFIGALVGYHT